MQLASHLRHFQNPDFTGPSFSIDCSVGNLDGREPIRMGEGEPLVLLPGLAGGWQLVLPLARILARSHEVILLSLPGDHFPRSRQTHQGLFEDATAVAHAIRELGLERPSIFGLSYGGCVALELAARFSHIPGHLVLYGADSHFENQQALSLVRDVLERYPVPSDSPFLNQFFNILHGMRPQPGTPDSHVLQHCWATDQTVVARRLRSLASYDLRHDLSAIDIPTLVLAGARDVVVTPQRQKALSRALPLGQFRQIQGAGHVGFLAERVSVARLVRRFLHSMVRVS